MDTDRELVDMYGRYFLEKRKSFQDKMPSFKPYRFGWADQWLEQLAELFLHAPPDYVAQHRKKIIELAQRQLREKSKYYFFLDALKSIERRFNLPFPKYLYELKEERPTLSSFLMTELLLIWALTEKDGRLLVCVRDEFRRKRFPLPGDAYLRRKAVTAIGHQVLAILPFMTPKHLDLIPDKFGPLDGIDPTIHLPVFDNAVEDVLADARMHWRYTVDPAGALVRWTKNSQDLKETFLKMVDGILIGRAETVSGGALAFVNPETGEALDFILHQSPIRNPLALSLASAYHKLVTAKELRANRETRLGRIGKEIAEPPEEEPRVIYVPRTILVGQGAEAKFQEVLPRQSSLHASPRDHVRHLEGGQMSAEQRRRVEEFERTRGVSVLKNLRPGCTYVLPHDWRDGSKRDVIYVAPQFAPALG
ncbi:MAG: hypothetical protein HY443_01475 [Candidatus Nealsonbacteria bacterium]|nr:hypothetical protein [Candidatus Nealsonbacteria bacterium]